MLIILLTNSYKCKSNIEITLTDSSTWVINKSLLFDKNDNPKNTDIEKIIQLLESRNGHGSKVTKSEFIKLFDRPESKTVYSKMLLKYATPHSTQIQEKEAEDYSKVFMQEKRILKGVQFIKDNYYLLNNAEKKYGVHKKDIVSILMWESGLGEFTGNFQIFNIFLGQILYLEKAQKFTVEELLKKGEINPLNDIAIRNSADKRLKKIKKTAIASIVSLLRECKKNNMDPLKQIGSWGGAIGYVQFMPFNLHLTVDGDDNGTKDLFSFPDAIYSCANFLKNYAKYAVNDKKRAKAIYRYNPSTNYVKGVILYADTIWERFVKENNKN
ncbi:MAG: lytic murein transglycosylase [bacterium]